MRPYCLHRKRHSVLCGDLTGKEIKKRGNICIHTADSLRCKRKRTQHCNGTILQYKKSPSSILTMKLYLKN